MSKKPKIDAAIATRNAIMGEADDTAKDTAAVNVAAATLTGDIRDFILNQLKFQQNKLPWNQRSEAEQKETIASVEAAVQAQVKRAVECIASRGLKTIRATLEQVVIKEGIKAQITLLRSDEQRHLLIDSTGSSIMIIVADTDEFTGEREPAEVQPDQRSLAMVVHSEPKDPPPPILDASGNEVPFH